MADVDVFETSRVVLRCTVVRGQAKSNKATFKVMRGGTAFLTKEVTLAGDKAYLTIEKLDEVKADEKNWELTYSVTCDGEAQDSTEVYKVWPLKLKLKAVDDKAKAFKGVQFVVKQAGGGGMSAVGWDEGFARTRPDGTVVHFFKRAGDFSVDVVGAHRITKWNKEAFRDLEAEVDDRTDPEFETPAQPADKKQLINLDSASNGADGKGSLVTFTVYSKGPGGSGKGGKTKNKIFIEVTFGQEKALANTGPFGSKRNNPERALIGALDIKPAQARKEKYTGYVELPSDGGNATFQVQLGKAGGDKCTVKIGGTPDCNGGPERTFINWNRLYYVVYAPDFMPLVDKDVDGKACKDLPANLVSQIKLRGDEAFFEYVLKDSHTFAEAAATPGCVKPGAFIGSASPKVYLLSDHSAPHEPAGAPDKTDRRVMIVKLCDKNLYFEGSASTVSRTATANPFEETSARYFVKVSGKDGTNAVKSIAWAADLTAATYFTSPTKTWKDAAAPTTGGAVNGQVVIHEMLQDQRLVLTFEKPMIGHIKQTLSSTEQAKIKPFIDGLLASADTLRAQGNKVKFELIAESGNDRRNARFTLVKGLVDTAFDSSPNRRKISTHFGVDDLGVAKSGNLDPVADVTEVDMKKFQVALPGVPGQLVNATVAPADGTHRGKCPIKLTIRYEVAKSGLGLCQNRENLVVFVAAAPDCTTDTLLHELAHAMGLVYYAGQTGRYGVIPPGETFPVAVAAGNAYIDHGGSGSHCAHSCADKSLPSFQGANKGTCIMLDWGPSTSPSIATDGFCDECKRYIRATDLSWLE